MTPEDASLMQTLLESGILSQEDETLLSEGGAAATSGAGEDHSAASVLRRLEDLGRLTPFQAQALRHGGPSSLTLGDYILQDRIGSGGMGEVYRAIHRIMRREVAIKRIKTGSIHSPGLAERFMREVRTAAKLSHPNIVAAYDAGQDETGCYLVMEYIDGRDLAELIREDGPMSLNQAAKALYQAAKAVACAHNAGIIHRDIKPGNFLITASGTLKLLDLGLARVEQTIAEAEQTEQMTLTQGNQVMGTLAYMAPEQAEDPHAAGVASDLYALGCTFCHMLTGLPPFSAKTAAQAIIAHRETPPPGLSRHLSPALNALYLSLMAKDPVDRPASADDVVKALKAIATKDELPAWLTAKMAQPPGVQAPATIASPDQQPDIPIARVKRKKKVGLLVWVAVGVAALVLLGVVGLFAVLNTSMPQVGESSEQPQPDPTETTPTNANENLDTTETQDQLPADTTGNVGPQNGSGPGIALPQMLNTPEAAVALQAGQAERFHFPVHAVNSVGMRMVYIPAGSCRFGSSDEDIQWALGQVAERGLDARYIDYINRESPQTQARVYQPFYMSRTEITVSQYRTFVEATGYETVAEREGTGYDYNGGQMRQARGASWRDPGMDQDGTHPAVNLALEDCIAYCAWMSELENRRYRLPTAQEWEYACRAGSLHRWSFGDDMSEFGRYGWCVDNANNTTHRVGQLSPNAFGLYDMHGNVREWVLLDYDQETDQGTGVLCGGSFTKPPVLLRSSSRIRFNATSPYPYHGFRVIIELGNGRRGEDASGQRQQ